MDTYIIKPMTRKQLDLAVDWAAAEGWNPGLHDADVFFSADPKGFFMGFLDGEPVAAVSAVRYGDAFGFAGFFLVTPEHRGNGYGFAIGLRALEHLEGRLIGLDGVVAQQENYKKAGFQLAYRNIRYEGMVREKRVLHADLVSLKDISLAKITACDQRFFPEERTAFLEKWITRPDTEGFGILKNGRMRGYGVIRPCRTGWKIGPLFAPDAQSAELLFQALSACAETAAPVFLDVPEINPQAVALAERHGMVKVFETARMYNQEPPDLPMGEIFGITTFELG